MGDPQVTGMKRMLQNASMGDGSKSEFGLNSNYLCSLPGLLRVINIALGIVSLGLWLPGYEDEFLGERISPLTGDTEGGYGNGWNQEPLNQFVLAAIIIALLASFFVFIGLVAKKSAAVDWHRFNKYMHLILSLFLLIAFLCAIFGAWYFTEACCHVWMYWEGLGMTFQLATGEGEGFYVRHCHCYLTRYFNQGDQLQTEETTQLYVATKHPNLGTFDHRWSFSAHDMNPHIAGIFIILLNALFYFLAFVFTKPRKPAEDISTG